MSRRTCRNYSPTERTLIEDPLRDPPEEYAKRYRVASIFCAGIGDGQVVRVEIKRAARSMGSSNSLRYLDWLNRDPTRGPGANPWWQ